MGGDHQMSVLSGFFHDWQEMMNYRTTEQKLLEREVKNVSCNINLAHRQTYALKYEHISTITESRNYYFREMYWNRFLNNEQCKK